MEWKKDYYSEKVTDLFSIKRVKLPMAALLFYTV
ncbi:hypothetical protein C806_01853 [Lachnospiraceae bacterium 3-1]|nr:hypothetical protein C806_01853 [Lachnospiraceae bacterium 3-1]